MNEPSRRMFLKQLSVAGATAATTPLASRGSQSGIAESAPEFATVVVPLDGEWQFALDPDGIGESREWFQPLGIGPDKWARVRVPHTRQVSPVSGNYQGIAWYRRGFDAPARWADKAVRIEFQAVSHSAKVWLNGKLIGQHSRRGYTAFAFDLAHALRLDGPNLLSVKVDNSFDENMLPRATSFDWTTDGGIIRPVRLLITPQTYIERLEIDAEPDLEAQRTRLHIRAIVHNASQRAVNLSFNYRVAEEESGDPLAAAQGAGTASVGPGASEKVSLTPLFEAMRLWHFDHPHLYRAVVEMEQQGKTLHSYAETFGARKMEVKAGGFYLNGERVRLMGVERMAGSHPNFGMAEPSSWITHDHDDLKELNCVFTRVHWEQEKRVLDYCDRHGILIQEEIPAWGPDTFKGMEAGPSREIMENGIGQLREMIVRDYNHPSIFAWGLCNEVNGQNPPAKVFIQRMAAEARKLDPHRLLTYASNSLQQNPGNDAAGSLDFISWNEYYESWFGGNTASVRQNVEEIHRAFPDKPIVVSEYGYCECAPDRTGGDARRIEILRDHTNVFRDFDFVGGAIFFDYNDYRTHIGDKGIGVLKQRVHGVVDLYGNRKPSFEALRQESSPVESLRLTSQNRTLSATVAVRKTLPAYTLQDYMLRWIVFGFGDLPMEEGRASLPKLAPGEEATVSIPYQEKQPRRIRVDVLRPTGFSAFTAWWKPSP